MLLRHVLALLLCVAGCRIERPAEPGPPDATPPGSASDAVQPEGPPVMAGDTARVTAEEAGEASPPYDGRPTVAASGLAIPVMGVDPADLVDTFTAARSEGRTHDAIDILAPRGTPVVAATSGEIVRLFTSDRGGLTVYQLGPDRRTVYYYAHLDRYAEGLAAGQRVRRGQMIGTVGDSGNAVPGNTHLHFAIWAVDDPADFWDGEPVNPYDLLARP